ncbi:MAG: DDE-type integrase/transposase/recombinase [Bdellovibrionota bacterium]
MPNPTEKLDKQHRYPWPVIETAVHLHLFHKLTYRSISEKMLGFGVEVSHKTIFEWVQKFSSDINVKTRKSSQVYSIEESYVKCNGEWRYMYRAHDSKKFTIGVFLRAKRSLLSAKSFFKKNLEFTLKEGQD